ncbi:MAG TPA: ABC transporter ATP-binding protein [Thermoclostridium sp.]|nr:ABC transporter ATP-binding protein [Thermoclostridium sp.]HPU45847.1 ABC transporter ATP-binding protein [Thermoclostridium sp.]
MIDVWHLYHDYTGTGKFAVLDVTFSIPKGTIFGCLGPSGAGKSTIQNIMTGLLKLQRGEVSYEGKSVNELGVKFFNRIGVSFEQPNVYRRLTGYENLKYFAGLFSVPTLDPMEVLDWVGLRDDAHKKASDYSKGMLQRLNLARSLINRPDILFLDEPTSGLDSSTASRIRNLIMEQKEKGATIFLTTHNMDLADRLCDMVAFLDEGSIAAMDTPGNLKLKYGKKEVMITYEKDGSLVTESFSMDDKAGIASLIDRVTPVKIHSQEATLEDIFIRVTGRGLS